jgi:hypothetical protein
MWYNHLMGLPKKKPIICHGGPFDGLVTYQGVYDGQPYPEFLGLRPHNHSPFDKPCGSPEGERYKRTDKVDDLGFRMYEWLEGETP